MKKAPNIRRAEPEKIATADPLITARGIRKSFGSTVALRNVDVRLLRGEVHALLGQNGAGKSTFVKVLCGALAADDGMLEMDSQPLLMRSVRDAIRFGIVPVYQQLSVIPALTVLENIAAFNLASGSAWGAARVKAHRRNAEAAMEKVGLRVPLTQPVHELSLGDRQLVEIARAVAQDCRLLILDEPTASADQEEVARLLTVVRSLCGQGIAVLYISHRLDEIRQIADRVTVFRDGTCAMAGLPLGDVSSGDIVSAMVGTTVSAPDKGETRAVGQVVMQAGGLSSPPAFGPVDISVRAGEILGIAGLAGSGAIELGMALAGGYPLRFGRISVEGKSYRRPRRATLVRAGVGLIPLDRDLDGSFDRLSVADNTSAQALGTFATLGILRRRAELRQVSQAISDAGVVPAGTSHPAGALSGGNLQKVIFARNLVDRRLCVLIALEPSRGVDIGAREQLRIHLHRMAAEGRSVVVISSDAEELSGRCDRILVIRGGQVADTVPGMTSQEDLLGLMAGVTGHES